jgi:hypothetical protein
VSKLLRLISVVLGIVGLAFLVLAVIYLTKTPHDLPSFIPGHVSHVQKHSRHYTKRAAASIVVAVIAFAGAAAAAIIPGRNA